MKKFYTLIATALFTVGVSAQELLPNGGFESWADGAPEGWTVIIPENGGSAVQENTTVHGGDSSAKITAPMGTGNVALRTADFDVIPGTQYTFSYWYNDSSDDARMRHWSSWRDSGGAQLDANLDVLQPTEYLSNSNGWTQVTITLTAPANAAKFRLDFRTYREGDNGGGVIYLDDASFMGPNMSVADLNASNVSMTTVWNNTANFNAKGNASVEIYTLNGQLVQKGNGNNNFELNVSNLAKGVYIVKVAVDGKVTTQKVVKK